MTRRSARRDKTVQKNQGVLTLLAAIMDKVHRGKSKKERFRHTLEVMEYIITHFKTIRHAYNNEHSFANFAKVTYHKIEELIETGREALQEGEKVKTSIIKLQKYQCQYEKIYVAYEEQRLLETRSQTMTTLMAKKQRKSTSNCQEMKKHIKKFLANQLPLCYDVIEIIKSYCFYDVKTFTLLKFVKELKCHIVTLFDFAAHSRKNGFGEHDEEDSDEIEHWAFCIDEDEIAFQGVNCKFCGNYWAEYSPDWAPRNILCHCEFDNTIEN